MDGGYWSRLRLRLRLLGCMISQTITTRQIEFRSTPEGVPVRTKSLVTSLPSSRPPTRMVATAEYEIQGCQQKDSAALILLFAGGRHGTMDMKDPG